MTVKTLAVFTAFWVLINGHPIVAVCLALSIAAGFFDEEH